MSRFFIGRPIFAAVISIVITLAGLVASQVLPIAQYPEIAPPTVTITATYPGASAETLAKTVAAPIEEQLSGVEGLLYYSSTAASNGVLTITATFEVGTNIDIATIQLNNRVQIALPRLPDEVRRTGVVVQKRSADILMAIGVKSSDPRYDTLYLSNYMTVNVLDALRRVPGVADAMIFGARDYSMRIWLEPDRMAQLGITTTEIANVIQAQNNQYAAGKIGAEPAPDAQSLVYSVTTRGRLVDPAEFGNIVLRASGPGGALRLKDVARVELGAVNYDAATTVDGLPSVGIGVFLQSGANALKVADAVRSKMVELATSFPTGISYLIPFDTTRFVTASIREVVHTLLIAALLVIAVVYLFLQSWRATLIPMIAVPVSLIGTFAGLYAFGFSINTLTLFAMVLAIGIVVDDAIVVLENVERLMAQRQLRPYEAAVEGMREVAGAVVAIVLVLCAVFIPVAFLGGIAGRLYQQFAVTVTIAVVISGLMALTLTPALCALLLKPNRRVPALFRPFNRAFGFVTGSYVGGVQWFIRRAAFSLLLFAVVIGTAVWLIRHVPTSFVPPEDMGYLYGSLVLPDAASVNRTEKSAAEVQRMLEQNPAVEHVFAVSGFDLIGGGYRPNAATLFIMLKDWDRRSQSANDVIRYIAMKAGALRDGVFFALNPPPIRGLGTAAGFEVYVQSRASSDPKALGEALQQFLDALRTQRELVGITSFFRPNVPQLSVEVDREKAIAAGVPINDIFDTLQATTGSLYVNDFNKFGRTFRVQLEADAPYRMRPQDLGEMYVRSTTNKQMLPLKTFIRVKHMTGPEQLDRFNGFLAAKVLGSGAPGVSSGQTIQLVEQIAKQALPPGYAIEWSGQAFQEKRIGHASILAFAFAIVMVFLILAAQYERWSLPLAVILAVPFAVSGALIAVLLRGMTNDIYFQIGLVTLIGLAAKNAILIVEFAAQKREAGLSAVDAAVEAARLRFRPIIMTSLAFVLGVLPLAIAAGAGAAARSSMGTGVLGGMLAATFIATLFIPLFFRLLASGRQTHARSPEAAPDNGQGETS